VGAIRPGSALGPELATILCPGALVGVLEQRGVLRTLGDQPQALGSRAPPDPRTGAMAIRGQAQLAAVTSQPTLPEQAPGAQVPDPQQLRHLGRARTGEYLLTWTGLKHPAARDHDHLVGEQRGLLRIVGDEHGGDARVPLQRSQLSAQLLAHRAVERRERLVKQQQLGIAREGSRQRHTLALATGQLVGQALAQLRQTEPLEPGGRARGIGARTEGDLSPNGETGNQAPILRHPAYPSPLRGQRRQPPPAKPHLADRAAAETREAAQRQGLAGARGAEQRQSPCARAVGELELKTADEIVKLELQQPRRLRAAGRGSVAGW